MVTIMQVLLVAFSCIAAFFAGGLFVAFHIGPENIALGAQYQARIEVLKNKIAEMTKLYTDEKHRSSWLRHRMRQAKRSELVMARSMLGGTFVASGIASASAPPVAVPSTPVALVPPPVAFEHKEIASSQSDPNAFAMKSNRTATFAPGEPQQSPK